MSERILFIGYCWGAAGTTWLSRLLNAHEDILCMHSPGFPRFDPFVREDAMQVIDTVFRAWDFGGGYPIVGFTHGIPIEWYGQLSTTYDRQLRCFALTRHPIKRIESTVSQHLLRRERRLSSANWRAGYAGVYTELVRRGGSQFPDDFESLAFYHACSMVNSILVERQLPAPLFKMEELVAERERVAELVRYVSDGTCELSDRVVEKLQRTIVRARLPVTRLPAEAYHSWHAHHRNAYHQLVQPDAFKAYNALGYEFPHPI